MIRLAIRVRREHAEVALAELLELAPAGVEEVEIDEGTIEYAVYGDGGDLPGAADLRAVVGSALVDVSTSTMADDWSERWRTFHRPVLVVCREPVAVPALHVRPPWAAPGRRPESSSRLEEIVIDPGQAFGTGAHATTRLCLELLLILASRGLAGGPLIDVGCGSGVLSIAAARLGWSPVLGLDHEDESVAATRANAAVNGVAVEARHFDLCRDPMPMPEDSSGADVTVLANLLRPLLLALADAPGAPPRQLVAGGLLRGEVDEVRDAFASRAGLIERERLEIGEWAALLLAPDR